MIGPSIVPSPPMMVANAISTVHCTLNTPLGSTWSWLIARTAPAARQPAPATPTTQCPARPTRRPGALAGSCHHERKQPGQAEPHPGAARGHLVVADSGEHQADPAAQQQVD